MPATIRRVVIDGSALASPALEAYFRLSENNHAVMIDYAGLETFRRGRLEKIRESYALLRRYPNRVIVLKPTIQISKLKPRSNGLINRMTDDELTDRFPNFVKLMFDERSPDLARLRQQEIERKAAVAEAQIAKLTQDAETVRQGMSLMMAQYPPAMLSSLRKATTLPPEFRDKVRDDILVNTGIHLKTLFPAGVRFTFDEIAYSLLFRYAACSYVLFLKWAADQGHKSARAEKLRNDCTDMVYAAFATFFDGLITEDGKLAELFATAQVVLKSLFGVS